MTLVIKNTVILIRNTGDDIFLLLLIKRIVLCLLLILPVYLYN